MRLAASLLVVLLTALPAEALAQGARPMYERTGVRFSAASTSDHDLLRATIEGRLDERRLKAVVVRDGPDGAEVEVATRRARKKLADLPLHALKALVAAPCERWAGTERDLLVPVEGEGVYPVTVWCDEPKRPVIEFAIVPLEVPELASTTEERVQALSDRFGVGRFVNGESQWKDWELDVAAVALAAMSEPELAVLEGLPFVRNRSPSEQIQRAHAAYFSLAADGKAAIVVLDNVFSYRDVRFIGSPLTPRPAEASTILHEAGHAIARASLRVEIQASDELRGDVNTVFAEAREAYDEYLPRAQAYGVAVDAYQARVEEYEALRLKAKRRETGTAVVRMFGESLAEDYVALEALREELVPWQERYEAYLPQIEVLRVEAEQRGEAIEELTTANPVLRAYARLKGARHGPTSYGATDVDEGFAESYALFRLDPEALRRFSPAIHDWFAADEHLGWLPGREP